MATQLKKIVAPSGGDYTSLEACMHANEQNLTAADNYFDVEISGDWSAGADTTVVDINGYTTDATRYINIYTTGNARHDGKRFGSKSTAYQLASGTDSTQINVNDLYVTINGLQISLASGTLTSNRWCITDGQNNGVIKNNICYGGGNANASGISFSAANGAIYRNLVYGTTGTAAIYHINSNTGTVYYNNTAYNTGSYGCRERSGSGYEAVWINNVSLTGTRPFTTDNSWGDGTDYNVSSHATYTTIGANTLNEKTAANQFVNIGAGTEDLHLKSTSDSCIDNGSNLGSPYDYDIDDVQVSGTWDRGADEYVAAGTAIVGQMTTNTGFWGGVAASFLLAFSLLFSWCSPAWGAVTSTSCYPLADVQISNASSGGCSVNSNCDDEGGLTIRDSSTATNNRASILQFGLGGGAGECNVPPNVNVLWTTLELTSSATPNSTAYLGLYKMMRSDWSETQSTWTNYKTGSAWTTAGGRGLGDMYGTWSDGTNSLAIKQVSYTASIYGAGTKLTFDTTAAFKLYIEGLADMDGDAWFIIQEYATKGVLASYYDSENATETNRPKLSIVYDDSSTYRTWYVRTNGGTKTQCNGLFDADYDGAGTLEDCAFNHPSWLTGAGSSYTVHTTGAMESGDIGVIQSGSSYAINYLMPNTSGCSSSWTYNCGLFPTASGTSSRDTTIIGCSSTGCADEADRPEFYLQGRLDTMMGVNNLSYFTLSDLEVTDHWGADASCEKGLPLQECGRTAISGWKGWHHLTFRNLNIHGLTSAGFRLGSDQAPAVAVADVALTLDNVRIHANGYAGFDADTNVNAGYCIACNASCSSAVGGRNICSYVGYKGNITWNKVQITYNGCDEAYPLTGVGLDLVEPSCREGNNGGYGDGVGTAATGGNWTLTDCNISHNASDGLDLLYVGNMGKTDYAAGTLYDYGDFTVNIFGGTYEGNNGQGVKSPVGTKIYSAKIIGNCTYFWTNGALRSFVVAGFVPCRAGGTPIAFSNKTHSPPEGSYIYNSTLFSEGDVMIGSSQPVYLYNSLIYGSYQAIQDPEYGSPSGYLHETDLFYAEPQGTMIAYNNICYGVYKNNVGSAWCTTGTNQRLDPKVTGTILTGTGPDSYYIGTDYASEFDLAVDSPLRNAVAISFQDAYTKDFYGIERGALPWDIGASEYGSSQQTCNSSCTACNTEASCEASTYPCYWWSTDSCSATEEPDPCDSTCTSCTSEAACNASALGTCNWWSDSTCQATAEPSCNSDCSLCDTQVNCEASSYPCFWWVTGVCSDVADSETCDTSCDRCITGQTCWESLTECYWWGTAETCNAESAPPECQTDCGECLNDGDCVFSEYPGGCHWVVIPGSWGQGSCLPGAPFSEGENCDTNCLLCVTKATCEDSNLTCYWWDNPEECHAEDLTREDAVDRGNSSGRGNRVP